MRTPIWQRVMPTSTTHTDLTDEILPLASTPGRSIVLSLHEKTVENASPAIYFGQLRICRCCAAGYGHRHPCASGTLAAKTLGFSPKTATTAAVKAIQSPHTFLLTRNCIGSGPTSNNQPTNLDAAGNMKQETLPGI